MVDPQQLLRTLDPADAFSYEEALNQISRCGEGVFSFLCQTLQSSHNPLQVREAAAWVLGDLQFAHSATALVQMLEDPSERLRATVARVLARVDGPIVGPALAGLYSDRSADVRRAAITGLHDHSHPSVLSVVLAALRDPEASVRSAAAYALEGFDAMSRAVEPLLAALRDPDPGVRGNAAAALGKLQADVAAEPLIRLTYDHSTYPRSAAAAALGALRCHRAVSRLCELLRDTEETVRRAAIRSLERLENPQCLSFLWQALADSNQEVRDSATRLMGRLSWRDRVSC